MQQMQPNTTHVSNRQTTKQTHSTTQRSVATHYIGGPNISAIVMIHYGTSAYVDVNCRHNHVPCNIMIALIFKAPKTKTLNKEMRICEDSVTTFIYWSLPTSLDILVKILFLTITIS